MRSRFNSWLMWLAVIMVCTALRIASAQTNTPPALYPVERNGTISVCDNTMIKPAASDALRLACQKTPISAASPSALIPLIVVGFVGGFAKPDDLRHPEPLFALYLQQHYGAELHAKVFSNHNAKGAKLYVLKLLDTDHDGVVSAEEKKKARIVIYGHSWGASETTAFARKLGELRIPVLLTIQLDIISKPRQEPDVIPPNVAEAINFYQSEGPLHGRPLILASNPSMTTILGNVHMVYDRLPVNCDNYNWFVRNFNKPHHEIENDPHVWDQVSSLIDAEVFRRVRPSQPQSPPAASATKGESLKPAEMRPIKPIRRGISVIALYPLTVAMRESRLTYPVIRTSQQRFCGQFEDAHVVMDSIRSSDFRRKIGMHPENQLPQNRQLTQ